MEWINIVHFVGLIEEVFGNDKSLISKHMIYMNTLVSIDLKNILLKLIQAF